VSEHTKLNIPKTLTITHTAEVLRVMLTPVQLGMCQYVSFL